jgi:hypothetical protein
VIFLFQPQIFRRKRINILFNDRLQDSNAPKKLISSSLADYYNNTSALEITLDNAETINCVGIGNTTAGAKQFQLINTGGTTYTENITFSKNGLYLLSTTYTNIKRIKIVTTGNYGRIAAGLAINLRTSIPKEPTLVSTNKPRVTLSGQVIDGLDGYNYWRVSLDTRYKIDNDKLNEIIRGFPSLSKGLPIFVSFEDEINRLPFSRLYANDTNQQELSFESSINKPLFSRRFVFEERY